MKIKAIIKEPNKPYELVDFENEINAYENFLGGFIECVSVPQLGNITMVINEEGKLDNLPPNIAVFEYQDVIAGSIVFVGVDYDKKEFISLTDEQIEVVKNYINRYSIENFS